jgi:WD40 repeat protein
MKTSLHSLRYKGPITSCEYLNDNKHLLIGCGPYLYLINEDNLEELNKLTALKSRVIHKIIIFNNYICVFGQKAFNVFELNEIFHNSNNSTTNDNLIELDDWIFDLQFISEEYLIIVTAHNHCILYNLQKKTVETTVKCQQKCMLYSAKIIDFNKGSIQDSYNYLSNILIASGTVFNKVIIWSPKSGLVYTQLSGHEGVIFNLNFSFNNSLLFSVSDDRSINVWQLELEIDENNNIESESHAQFKGVNGKLIKRLYGHDARVWNCVPFVDKTSSPDKQYLVSIGEDLNCCLWSVDCLTNDDPLIYRFDAMRKGSKNIWCLCVNEDKLTVITGWADGGLRRFQLKNHIKNYHQTICDNEATFDQSLIFTHSIESLKINSNNDDYFRTILLFNNQILTCTNDGCLYLIQIIEAKRTNCRLLLHHKSLIKYNIMERIEYKQNDNIINVIAIGTKFGDLFLLKIDDTINIKRFKCFPDRIVAVGIHEVDGDSTEETKLNKKLFSLSWNELNGHLYLAVSFTFLDGLVHLYEVVENEIDINLIQRFYLPLCKHRWLTSFLLFSRKKLDLNDNLVIICGDKSGNLSLFLTNKDTNEPIRPIQSIRNVTKDNSAIPAIYNLGGNESGQNWNIVCCCKDGYYRVYEVELFLDKTDQSNMKLINKYEINSYIDCIERFIFRQRDDDSSSIVNNNLLDNLKDLSLSLCFYGDKFILWNFKLNRALAQIKCGGSNRSWDYEFFKLNNQVNLFRFLFFSCFLFSIEIYFFQIYFRFIYIKNRDICEVIIPQSLNELDHIIKNSEGVEEEDKKSQHLNEIFHGNQITTGKFIPDHYNYIITGSEDTQIILTELRDNFDKEQVDLYHRVHLQGHQSVVRCINFYQLKNKEILMVSAGGKANIKLWKIQLDGNNNNKLTQITNLCEFKKTKESRRVDKISLQEKAWQKIDLNESNNDVRFMDVVIYKDSPEIENDFSIVFACSDGHVRLVFLFTI